MYYYGINYHVSQGILPNNHRLTDKFYCREFMVYNWKSSISLSTPMAEDGYVELFGLDYNTKPTERNVTNIATTLMNGLLKGYEVTMINDTIFDAWNRLPALRIDMKAGQLPIDTNQLSLAMFSLRYLHHMFYNPKPTENVVKNIIKNTTSRIRTQKITKLYTAFVYWLYAETDFEFNRKGQPQNGPSTYIHNLFTLNRDYLTKYITEFASTYRDFLAKDFKKNQYTYSQFSHTSLQRQMAASVNINSMEVKDTYGLGWGT